MNVLKFHNFVRFINVYTFTNLFDRKGELPHDTSILFSYFY